MKLLIVIILIVTVFVGKCTESIGGQGDCFSFIGITYTAVDSSKLQGVTVSLTDFKGHFENPIRGRDTILTETYEDNSCADFLDKGFTFWRTINIAETLL